MAKARGIIGKLFGPNSMARQFFVWGVGQSVVEALMTPFIIALTNRANSAFPEAALPPAELASMVVRGILSEDDAAKEARKSGIDTSDFRRMVTAASIPPSIGDLLMLWRRGKVSESDVRRALQQSNVKDEWHDTVMLLGVQPPTPTDILDALLQGQVDDPKARALYRALGGDPDFFQLLYDTRGSAPTPNEAAEMARKGIIPWEGRGAGVVSFEQAFLEGPWRNKWLRPWRETTEYLPPPRTITAMLREGALTEQEAIALLVKQGVPAELIPNYLAPAVEDKVKAAKELTESTVSTLYQENAISEADAAAHLKRLRYSDEAVAYVLTAWKLARELRFRNTAINTVRTQYVNHKLTTNEATQLLDQLGVPATQRTTLLQLWFLEASTKVATLTAAQVKSAWKKSIIGDSDAIDRLLQMGYSFDDAAIFLSI